MRIFQFEIIVVLLANFALMNNSFHCTGNKNNQEVLYKNFEFQKEVKNGKLYFLSGKGQTIKVVALRGSWMEMGIAMGKLLKDEINYNIKYLFEYLKELVRKYLGKYLPSFIIEAGLSLFQTFADWLENLTWIFTRDYTPERYFEEMKGISIGAEVEYMDIVRLFEFPELIKASCSLVGVWDKAAGEEGALLFLRALDWSTEFYVTKNPVIAIYHPEEPNSIPFANLGYAGLVGSFTAINANGLMIGEKVWRYPKTENVETSRVGKPWHCVIRDVAQFTDTMPEAIKMVVDAPRTCAIHLGIATKKEISHNQDHSYRALHYSYNRLNVYTDKNFPQQDEVHPYLENIAYWDRFHQPTVDRCMGEVLKAGQGQINSEYLYRMVAPLVETGNAQLLIIDVTNMKMHLAYSLFDPPENAYDRSFFHVDINS